MLVVYGRLVGLGGVLRTGDSSSSRESGPSKRIVRCRVSITRSAYADCFPDTHAIEFGRRGPLRSACYFHPRPRFTDFTGPSVSLSRIHLRPGKLFIGKLEASD